MSQSEEPEVEERLEPQLEPDEGTYRFTGDHAVTLDSGQPIAPGEYVTFDNKGEANKNKRGFEEGHLLPAPDAAPAEPKSERKTQQEKGGS